MERKTFQKLKSNGTPRTGVCKTWNPPGTYRNHRNRPEPNRNHPEPGRNHPEPHINYPELPGALTENNSNKKNQIKVIRKQNKKNKNQINKIIKISSFHIKKNGTARD